MKAILRKFTLETALNVVLVLVGLVSIAWIWAVVMFLTA